MYYFDKNRSIYYWICYRHFTLDLFCVPTYLLLWSRKQTQTIKIKQPIHKLAKSIKTHRNHSKTFPHSYKIPIKSRNITTKWIGWDQSKQIKLYVLLVTMALIGRFAEFLNESERIWIWREMTELAREWWIASFITFRASLVKKMFSQIFFLEDAYAFLSGYWKGFGRLVGKYLLITSCSTYEGNSLN